MLGLPSHSPRGADGQRGFPGQEVHLPPGVPQTVCSAVFFCEERSTCERLLYLKHLPTHAAPTRRGCDSCLLRIRGSPRTDFGHTEIPRVGMAAPVCSGGRSSGLCSSRCSAFLTTAEALLATVRTAPEYKALRAPSPGNQPLTCMKQTVCVSVVGMPCPLGHTHARERFLSPGNLQQPTWPPCPPGGLCFLLLS